MEPEGSLPHSQVPVTFPYPKSITIFNENNCLLINKLFIYIQEVHKWMVQFQKLTRNLFLTLYGQNVQHQQRQLSQFLMC